jgi:two-component system, NarL family, nitrate/nitrite response regulator NarL
LNQNQDNYLKTPLTTVLVVDDHPVTTRGLHWLFSAQARTTTIEVAHSIDEAIAKLNTCNRDEYLVLLDLSMPGVSGLEGFNFFRRQWPTLKIAIYSGHEEHNLILEALRNQAAGFIPKSMHPDLVVDAVFLMLDGGIYMPSDLLLNASLQPGSPSNPNQPQTIQRIIGAMPPRRLEVLKLMANGANNKDVCRQLNMSVNTVKTHVSLIFASLEVHSRQELVSLMQSFR